MLLESPSRPAYMHALSKSCLAIRLASSGLFFLCSLSLTISSLFLSNSKVTFLSYVLGLPALIRKYVLLIVIPLKISWRPFASWHWRWDWWPKLGPSLICWKQLPCPHMVGVRFWSITRMKWYHLLEVNFHVFTLLSSQGLALWLLWAHAIHPSCQSQRLRTLGLSRFPFHWRWFPKCEY